MPFSGNGALINIELLTPEKYGPVTVTAAETNAAKNQERN
jgi:hypothetical protein